MKADRVDGRATLREAFTGNDRDLAFYDTMMPNFTLTGAMGILIILPLETPAPAPIGSEAGQTQKTGRATKSGDLSHVGKSAC